MLLSALLLNIGILFGKKLLRIHHFIKYGSCGFSRVKSVTNDIQFGTRRKIFVNMTGYYYFFFFVCVQYILDLFLCGSSFNHQWKHFPCWYAIKTHITSVSFVCVKSFPSVLWKIVCVKWILWRSFFFSLLLLLRRIAAKSTIGSYEKVALWNLISMAPLFFFVWYLSQKCSREMD